MAGRPHRDPRVARGDEAHRRQLRRAGRGVRRARGRDQDGGQQRGDCAGPAAPHAAASHWHGASADTSGAASRQASAVAIVAAGGAEGGAGGGSEESGACQRRRTASAGRPRIEKSLREASVAGQSHQYAPASHGSEASERKAAWTATA